MKRTSSNYRKIAKYLTDTHYPYSIDHVAAIFDTFMLIDQADPEPRYAGPSGYFNMIRDAITYIKTASPGDLDALVKEAIS